MRGLTDHPHRITRGQGKRNGKLHCDSRRRHSGICQEHARLGIPSRYFRSPGLRSMARMSCNEIALDSPTRSRGAGLKAWP